MLSGSPQGPKYVWLTSFARRIPPARAALVQGLRGEEIERELLGREDSNLRLADPESAPLPLGHSPRVDVTKFTGHHAVAVVRDGRIVSVATSAMSSNGPHSSAKTKPPPMLMMLEASMRNATATSPIPSS